MRCKDTNFFCISQIKIQTFFVSPKFSVLFFVYVWRKTAKNRCNVNFGKAKVAKKQRHDKTQWEIVCLSIYDSEEILPRYAQIPQSVLHYKFGNRIFMSLYYNRPRKVAPVLFFMTATPLRINARSFTSYLEEESPEIRQGNIGELVRVHAPTDMAILRNSRFPMMLRNAGLRSSDAVVGTDTEAPFLRHPCANKSASSVPLLMVSSK